MLPPFAWFLLGFATGAFIQTVVVVLIFTVRATDAAAQYKADDEN